MNGKRLDYIKATYTEIRPVVIEDEPEAHNVFLMVKQQSFCITPYACEDKESAAWTQDMLAKAILKIIKIES